MICTLIHSQETMRLSTADSWNTMFEFICGNLATWRLKDLKSDEEFLIKCGLIPHVWRFNKVLKVLFQRIKNAAYINSFLQISSVAIGTSKHLYFR